jgi:hypothetical protein
MLDMRIELRNATRLALLLLAAASAVRGQQPVEPTVGVSAETGGQIQTSSDVPATVPRSASLPGLSASAPQAVQPTHRFWDRTNDLWFAGVGAARALDYASTLNIRRRGLNEAFLTNSIVDNHPLFAGIEASATAASIGLAYLFHRTDHHRLERWTSIVHFSIAVGGAVRNYALKTPHQS